VSQAAPSERVVARGTHPAGMEVVAPADLGYPSMSRKLSRPFTNWIQVGFVDAMN
jgi:hypothetical protein